MRDLKVAVIGAGVVGLTTALEIQKEFRHIDVTIVADKFLTDTTSDGAAGLFRPGTDFSGPTEEITRQWVRDSFNHWDGIRTTAEAPQAGIAPISGYIFSSTDPDIVKNRLIEKILPIYRSATEEELKICPGNWKYGSFYSTLLIECRRYQPWATEHYKLNGGKIVLKKIDNLSELYNDFDVLVNCSGFGARYLCNDYKVVPIRGQVIKVHAPWLKTVLHADYDTYIIPGFENVTLGGCRQYHSYNLNTCKYDSASIRERCESLVPSLKTSPTVREWVGLRPFRAVVRVEKELINVPNHKKVKMIHNYGHGGFGVTTAPGTSKYAVKLMKEMLMGNSKL